MAERYYIFYERMKDGSVRCPVIRSSRVSDYRDALSRNPDVAEFKKINSQFQDFDDATGIAQCLEIEALDEP